MDQADTNSKLFALGAKWFKFGGLYNSRTTSRADQRTTIIGVAVICDSNSSPTNGPWRLL